MKLTYVKNVNCLSWAIKREGKPEIEVRGLEKWDIPNPYQIICRHYPYPSTIETWKWLLKRRVETPENCAKLGRELIRLSENFTGVEDVLLEKKVISKMDYERIKKGYV